MQNSARRHVLADVRLQCGLTQGRVAQILKCHLMTVQKIEQGLLAMSPEIARRVAKEFDLSEAWLRANDPKQPPITSRGSLWDKRHYQLAQDRKRVSLTPGEADALSLSYPLEIADFLLAWQLEEFRTAIHALLEGTKGTANYGLVSFRLNELLVNLASEFEPDGEILAEATKRIEKLKKAYVDAAIELTTREFARTDRPGKVKFPGLTVRTIAAPKLQKD